METNINIINSQNFELWKKLHEIQKAHKGFLESEESGTKKGGTKESAYSYTPGAEITTSIRKKMDELGIMMPVDIISESHQIYIKRLNKYINGVVVPIDTSRTLFTVTVQYWFVDVTNGQSIGPLKMTAAGENDSDKGVASAISLAERYIFLKTFHIPTKDKMDEPNAYDSNFVAGIPEEMQSNFVDATQAQIAAYNNNYNARQGQAPSRQAQYQPSYQPNVTIPVQQFSPEFTKPQAQAQASMVNDQFQGTKPDYTAAMMSLAQFNKGTQSFSNQLQVCLTKLNQAGYPTANPTFQQKLVEDAQAFREQRMPVYSEV